METGAFSVEHLSKTFPGQRALDDVSLELRSGEVLGLLGENGSGKSTLIKVLAGYHLPDPGSAARMDGEAIDLAHQSHAWRRRFHFIHQDPALVLPLSTVENLALGRGYATGRLGRIRWRAEARRAEQMMSEFGVPIDVWAPVAKLSAAERALVAIVRALQDWDASAWNVLVLDEPTASLPSAEVDVLFRAVRRVADRGAGIIFVSHRLPEVFALTDRVMVLRNGRLVGSVATADVDHEGLVDVIVGRSIEDLYTPPPAPRDDVVLSVDKLSGPGIRSASFTVHRGEIVGVAGLLGSGREHLPALVFGARPRTGGTITLSGSPGTPTDPRTAIRLGFALVPANRREHGTIPNQSIRLNTVLPRLGPITTAGRISGSREQLDVEQWIARFDVRPPDPERKVINLSGGNQQKVVLAKWMRTNPKVLLLDEPTQGVDVGAKAQIYALVADAARQGVAVLVCSAEAGELAHICERVLVMRDGRIAAELSGAGITEDRIVAETLAAA